MKKPTHSTDTPIGRLSGSVERVTFHSEELGFCVLRAKVRGQHDLVTVIPLYIAHRCLAQRPDA